MAQSVELWTLGFNPTLNHLPPRDVLRHRFAKAGLTWEVTGQIGACPPPGEIRFWGGAQQSALMSPWG